MPIPIIYQTAAFSGNYGSVAANERGYFYVGSSSLPHRHPYVWYKEEAKKAFEADDADTLSEILGVDYQTRPGGLWTEAVTHDKPNVAKWLWCNMHKAYASGAYFEVLLYKRWNLFREITPAEFDRDAWETAMHDLQASELEPVRILLEKWKALPDGWAQAKTTEGISRCKLIEGYLLLRPFLTEWSFKNIVTQAVTCNNLLLVQYLVETEGLPLIEEYAANACRPHTKDGIPVLKYLLARGVSSQLIMKSYERSPVLEEALNLLLDHGAKVTPKLLEWAIQHRSPELLHKVLGHPFEDWGEAHNIAVNAKFLEAAKALIKAGCMPTKEDLIFASNSAHLNTEFVMTYLESGMSVGGLDLDALHEGHRDIVRRYFPTVWDHLEDN